MKPEIQNIIYRQNQIIIALDHDTACDILRAAGHQPPAIPEGCNTVLWHFKTSDGCPALAINQKGFKRKIEDNEQEVNGCTVMYLSDKNCDQPEKILEEFYRS